MSGFFHPARTVLFTLSVSALALVPITSFAQETAAPEVVVSSDAAPVEGAVGALMAEGAIPEDWQSYTRFGIQFALPAAMEVLEDRAESSRMDFYATDAPDTGDTGLRFGLRAMTAERLESLNAPFGSPEFLAVLSLWGGMPITRTDDMVLLGETPLSVYRGTGTVDGPESATVDTRMVFLVSEAPLDNGNTLIIAIFSAGLAASDAVSVEAAMVSTLAVQDPADLGRVTSLSLIDGVATVSIAEDIFVADVDTQETNRTVLLAHAEAPEAIHTAIGSWLPGPDGERIAGAMIRRFSAIDAVEEGAHQGVPVWVIAGQSLNTASGARATFEAPRARYVITQSCLPGDGGPVVLGVITTATRGAPVILDAIANTMSLTLPEGAAPCPAEIGAAILAMPIGAIDHPAPPEAEVVVPEVEMPEIAMPEVAIPEVAMPDAPEVMTTADWTEHRRFGFRILAPADMTVRRDRNTEDRREYWLTNLDEDTGYGANIVLRVFTDAQRAEVTEAAVGSPEFVAVLERLGSIPMERTGETVQIAGLESHFFRGTRTRETPDGPLVQNLLYIVNAQSSATGLNPWVALLTSGMTAAEAASFEAAAIGGLLLEDTALYTQTDAEAFLDGIVRIAVPEGLAVARNIQDSDGGTLLLADASAPEVIHTLYGIEEREEPGTEVAENVPRRLVQIFGVTQGVISGAPVWIYDGRARFTPDRSRLADGQTSPARMIITQQCLPGKGPLVIGVLSTDAQLAQAGGFDALTAPVQISLPVGSADCPAETLAALASVPVTGAAPTPEASPEVSPEPQPPVADAGKPDEAPQVVVDPEDAAWTQAREANSVAGMLAYLQAYPRGAYSQTARDWLAQQAPPPANPELTAWQAAASDGTAPAFWTYLKAYPRGQFAQAANAALAALLRVQVQQQPPARMPDPQPAPGKRA